MTDEAVSPLRRRMIEDMTIRKFAPKTQHDYMQRVKNFAAFLGRSPDTATFEDVRRYQLHLAASGVGVPTINQAVALVRELARLMPDRQIARLLNRSGKPTGYGNGWTEQRLRGFRKHHDIEVYRDGEWAERGEITLDAAAQIIGVAKMTALRMIRTGDLNGRQACKGAPWVIKAEDVATFGAQKRSTGPVTPNPAQQTLEFQ